MKTVQLSISKSSVYNEVAKLTAYVGSKTKDKNEENIYDTVFVTNDDTIMLERFWREARSHICDELKRFVTGITVAGYDESVDLEEQYIVTLQVTDRFDMNLFPAINDLIFSYFVNGITSKWFAIANRSDADYYIGESKANLNELKRKLFYRTKPVRPAGTGCAPTDKNESR